MNLTDRMQALKDTGLTEIDHMPNTACIDTTQLAMLLGVARGTVDRMREDGTGPAWQKAGSHYIYPAGNVREWLTQRATPIQQALDDAQATRPLSLQGKAALVAARRVNARRKAA